MNDGSSRSFEDDVGRQPENLLRAAETFLPALDEADLAPFTSDRLVLTGMGASLFAAMPAASALRTAGRHAVAVSPTELLDPGGSVFGGPVVGISQSGRSVETVEAFRTVSGPRLALTRSGDGPLAEAAELALPIGSESDSGISVMTYTASLFAAATLASRLAGGDAGPPPHRLAEVLALVVERAAAQAGRLRERFEQIRAVDVVGRGFSAASAGYAALLIREAARMPASSFDTRQYLHGPVEVAEVGLGAIVFGDAREVELARDLAGFGTTVLLVTGEDVGAIDGLEILRVPDAPGPLRPILEAVPAQVLAGALARAKGLSPGTFRREQADTKVGQ